MSKLARILAAQFGGEVPTDLGSAARELRDRFGSGRAVARELGVDEKTVRRWLSGETRSSARQEQVIRTVREQRARGAGVDKPVTVKLRYDGRDRKVAVTDGSGLHAGTAQSMREAYARGDQEGLARAFIDGVKDRWYHDRFEEAYEDDLRGEEHDRIDDYNAGFVG